MRRPVPAQPGSTRRHSQATSRTGVLPKEGAVGRQCGRPCPRIDLSPAAQARAGWCTRVVLEKGTEVRLANLQTGPNYTDLLTEPPAHAIGCSRGGWNTKVQHLVDGNGRPLVVSVDAGQAGDAPTF